MKRQLTEILRRADLKEDEIKVYLALLKFNTASVAQLQDATNLKSITVYRTIKTLLERSLIREVKINKKQSLYKALSLQSLISELEKQERKIAKLKNSIANLDPLLKFMDLNEEEDIEVKSGIHEFRAEYLKVPQIAEEEIYAFGSMCNCFKAVGDWDLDTPEERAFCKQRMSKGILYVI